MWFFLLYLKVTLWELPLGLTVLNWIVEFFLPIVSSFKLFFSAILCNFENSGISLSVTIYFFFPYNLENKISLAFK